MSLSADRNTPERELKTLVLGAGAVKIYAGALVALNASGYATKGALATVTKTLAMELGPKGIRVNGIHPGYIYGDSVEWYFNHQAEKRGITFQEVYDEVASETCLKYLPHSEEIAGTAVYFASPLAKPVTGQMIGVNAGHWFNG